MRANLYRDLCERLSLLDGGVIKHLDLWNRNVEFIEQEEGWYRPAVFIEFGKISWSVVVGGCHQRGEGSFKLHLVTDWKGSTAFGSEHMDCALSDLGFSAKIQAAIEGLSGDGYDGVRLIETYTNHDHEELVESIDVYSFKCLRRIGISVV